MDKKKRGGSRKSNRITAILFVAAAGLLTFGTVGSSRAALTYISDYYTAQIGMYDIGVTLMENGEDISWRNYTGGDDKWNENTGELVKNMLEDGEKLQPGKHYKEELTVKNSGNIDEYVRVMVYRYWVDDEGKKTDLSPELIDLKWTENSGWMIDESATTTERTVLYYDKILKVGETAPLFADELVINSSIANKVKVEEKKNGTHTTITATYDYDGTRFMLEAEVDAVQTHNAADAIKSAWGVDMAVSSGGNVSLK